MTDKEKMLELVQKTLMEMFKLSQDIVGLDKDLFNDMDLDSLDAIDLAVELTKRTGLKLNNDDLRAIRTVSDIVETIVAKQGAVK